MFKVTVNPLVVAAVAFTYILWGNISTANFKSWDFPNPGSPNNSIWLVSLNEDYFIKFLEDPPIIPSNIPTLTIYWPNIVGQNDFTIE